MGARLDQAFGHDWKGRLSPVLYLLGMGLAFVQPILSVALTVAVALIWFIPDRWIERVVEGEGRA